VVSLVLFFGMLTAVEVFGAESGTAEGAPETGTGVESPTTTATQPTTTQQATTTTTQQQTSTAKTTTAQAPAQTVQVSEVEFKITLSTTNLKAGKVTFEVKNDGKIAHDFAIKGGPKTPLIQPGGSATLTTTLPKVHVAISGIEKIVPTLEDVATPREHGHVCALGRQCQRAGAADALTRGGDQRRLALQSHGVSSSVRR